MKITSSHELANHLLSRLDLPVFVFVKGYVDDEVLSHVCVIESTATFDEYHEQHVMIIDASVD